MREILFRGKTDKGEWVQGQLLHFKASVGTEKFALIVEGCEWDNSTEWFNLGKRAKVIPSTIGQYTGLTDKNGAKVFEGDIVKSFYKDGFEIGLIGWSNIDFRYKFASPDGMAYGFDVTDVFEVVGNVHDNPELLKSEVQGE